MYLRRFSSLVYICSSGERVQLERHKASSVNSLNVPERKFSNIHIQDIAPVCFVYSFAHLSQHDFAMLEYCMKMICINAVLNKDSF